MFALSLYARYCYEDEDDETDRSALVAMREIAISDTLTEQSDIDLFSSLIAKKLVWAPFLPENMEFAVQGAIHPVVTKEKDSSKKSFPLATAFGLLNVR